MSETEITQQDRDRAQKCVDCPVCKPARVKQKGIAYWVVKNVEEGLCPNCKAYFKVYGRKAHEPNPE